MDSEYLLADGLDPRPDLAQDHRAWVILFQSARALYPPEHDGLHVAATLNGFRCLGCRLTVVSGKDGRARLRLLRGQEDYLVQEKYTAATKEYLDPIRAEVIMVFNEASRRWQEAHGLSRI